MILGSLFGRTKSAKLRKEAEKALEGGFEREGIRMLGEALAAAREEAPAGSVPTAEILELLARTLLARGHLVPALGRYREAIDICEKLGEIENATYVTACAGAAEILNFHLHGERSETNSLLSRGSTALLRLASKEPASIPALVDAYIAIHHRLGDAPAFRSVVERTLETVRKESKSDPGLTGAMYLSLARTYSPKDGCDAALAASGEAQKLYAQDLSKFADAHLEAVRIAVDCREAHGARERAKGALKSEIARIESNRKLDQSPAVWCRARLAQLHLRADELDAAAREAANALEVLSAFKRPNAPLRRFVLSVKGTVDALQGNEKAAEDAAKQFESILDGASDADIALLIPLCEALVRRGFLATAERYIAHVTDRLRAQDTVMSGELLEGLLVLAWIQRERSHFDAAESTLHEALERLDDENDLDTPRHGRVLIELADLYTAQEKYDRADELLSSAMYMVMEGDETEGDLPGVVINRMAVLNHRQGEREIAGELFSRSREMLEARGAFSGRTRQYHEECVGKGA